MDTALLAELRGAIGSRCSTGEADREHHGHDESYHHPHLPDAVCRVETTEEVAAIVRLCAARKVPVVAYGAGTSLEGHVIPVRGGVTIDLTGMNRVLEVRPEDLDVTVQAGVTRKQLNRELRDTGLFFPVDPGADASLGGMAATRASGTNAVRYGTMRENVLNLTVVLADGSVIRTASRARKSSAGYDLTRLFVGSEGTLGIITELTVRLYGIPEAVTSAVCAFPDVEGAVNTVIEAIQLGLPVARMELLDDQTMRAVNHFSRMEHPVAPTLFLEFHGTEAWAEEQARLFAELAAGHGGDDMRWATDPEERNRLWQARHDVHYAFMSMRPGKRVWSTDVCVPVSNLARCIAETREDTARASFFIGLVGHVGDGNFHLGIVIDPDSEAELAEAAAINERLVHRALAMDGTCTGEHGVGQGKSKFLREEHGAALAVMRTIKRALDPDEILNPGKILPAMN